MGEQQKDPAARPSANRVRITELGSSVDPGVNSEAARQRQARYLLKFYAVSLPLALTIAEHAFAGGRRA